MKKLGIVLALSMLLGLSGSIVKATSSTPGEYTVDSAASNPLSPSTAVLHYETDNYSGQDLCQKFTPSKEVIADYLFANVAGTNSGGAVMLLKADVEGMPGSGALAIFSAPDTFENPGHTYMSRFSSPGYTQVTPNAFYWLCLVAPRGNNVWWYATTPSSYDNGFLQQGIGGSQANQDFGFQIWSSNMQAPLITPEDPPTPPADPATPSVPTTPTSTATPAANTPLPSGVSAGSGAAPVTPTAAIKVPTEVTIADLPEDQGGSLKLDWKASSTTDITGYKVFRSTTEATKDFKEIVKTEKTVLTFTDNTAAIGQKFYYMVRAYKDAQESANSNIVDAVSVDNLAPAIPKGLRMVASGDTSIDFSWTANTEPDLAGYTLSVISSDDDKTVIDTIEINKAATTYKMLLSEHTKLVAGTDYLYYLQAKDANGNLSEKVIFPAEDVAENVASTTEKSPLDKILVSSAILLLLLVAGMVYLQINAKKNKTKVAPRIFWPIVGLSVVAAGIIAWRLIPAGTQADAKKEDKAAVVAPKHTDWPIFTGKKYPFTLSYPSTYVVTEGAGGNVSINKGADIIAEIYSSDSGNDEAGMMKASGALYLDASKGYMTGGVESATTAAGVSAKRYSGTFGKNAGAKVMVHDGIKGSAVIFQKNNRTWQFLSYDNSDPSAISTFDDMIADMKF